MAPLPPPLPDPTTVPPPNPQRSLFTASLGLARGQVVVFFFFAAFLFLLYQLFLIFSGFLAPIIWAVILAMLFSPLYRVVLDRCRGRETLAALVLTLLITTVIVLPTISLSSVITREAASLYQRTSEYVSSGEL